MHIKSLLRRIHTVAKKTFFQHVGSTPIVPISAKILGIFICLILLSNFTTNFINLRLSQRQVIKLTNNVLVNQLKDLYSAAGNQYQISLYSQNRDDSIQAIEATDRKSTRLRSSHQIIS